MPNSLFRQLLLATALTASAPAVAAPSSSAVSQRMLEDLVAVSGVPGLGAAVWRDDRIVWRGSAGMRNIERRLPVTDEPIFRLASVSKLLAATAAASWPSRGAWT